MLITFDSVNLNDGDVYRVTSLSHEGTSNRETFSYDLARQRGSVFVAGDYKSKEVTVSGIVKGTSRAELESNVDSFKELLSRKNKHLDIEFAGGTRRYHGAFVQSSSIKRKSSDITIAWWEATFVIPEGLGTSTNVTTETLATNYTSATKTIDVDIVGTTYPNPVISISIDSGTSITGASITCNGDKITATTSLVATDVLVFDTDNKIVTRNGTSIDYTGIFPRFYPGSNSIEIAVIGTARQYDATMTYYAKYL